MAKSLGVRKGAWTGEEDDLLRKCIEKYGEAKWHQIPQRAGKYFRYYFKQFSQQLLLFMQYQQFYSLFCTLSGLNRCRKSCRLRWLNYLKPNIKRGEFAADEVDLILRLHKLLGNRQVQKVERKQNLASV